MRLTHNVFALMTLAVAVATGTVACSSAPPSTPVSTASGSPSTADSLPAYGAPKVQHPLDVSKFQQNPCAMLTMTQLQQFGVAAAQETADNIGTGPACHWNDTDGPTGASFSALLIASGQGLSGAYRAKSNERLFQPIPDIEGYPALLVSPDDSRSQGACTLDVGTSDQQSVEIGVIMRGGAHPAPNYNDPCGVAETIAQQVVITLKHGGA